MEEHLKLLYLEIRKNLFLSQEIEFFEVFTLKFNLEIN